MQKYFRFSWVRTGVFLGLLGLVVFFNVMAPKFYFMANPTAYRPAPGTFTVHYVDVGHGDCTIIELPDGKIAIIDGGPANSVYWTKSAWPHVYDYINTRIRPKNNFIDYIINTHPHEDHVGGLIKIMERFRFGAFYGPFAEGAVPSFVPAAKRGYAKPIVEAGRIGDMARDGYEIQFHATAVVETGYVYDEGDQSAELNEFSPIISIRYRGSDGESVFFVTGDAGHLTENQFIDPDLCPSAAALLAGQIDNLYLRIGHHGSRNSTGIPFINFLTDGRGEMNRTAIVSLGWLYNHPHAEPIANLTSAGFDIIKTRDVGDIVVRLSQQNGAVFFFGYNNPPELTGLWIAMYIAVVFGCFLNLSTYNRIVKT